MAACWRRRADPDLSPRPRPASRAPARGYMRRVRAREHVARERGMLLHSLIRSGIRWDSVGFRGTGGGCPAEKRPLILPPPAEACSVLRCMARYWRSRRAPSSAPWSGALSGLTRPPCPSQSRQKRGTNSTSTVKSSSRPSSMAADSSHFAGSGKGWKVPEGPMVSPRPGPTLAIAVAAPLMLVT